MEAEPSCEVVRVCMRGLYYKNSQFYHKLEGNGLITYMTGPYMLPEHLFEVDEVQVLPRYYKLL
jgi:hypothetical protein